MQLHIADAGGDVEVAATEDVEIQLDFVTGVHEVANVDQLGARETERRSLLHRDQRLVGVLVEVRVLQVHATVQGTGVETKFDFARALRTEVGVADLVGGEGRLAGFCGHGAPGADGVERARRLAGVANGAAQLEGLNDAAGPERFIRDHVRGADLGVGLDAEALAEGAVAVGAGADRHEEHITPADGLLRKVAGVDHALLRDTRDTLERAREERRVAGAGEVVALQVGRVHLVLEQLSADGGAAAPVRGDLLAIRRRQVRREELTGPERLIHLAERYAEVTERGDVLDVGVVVVQAEREARRPGVERLVGQRGARNEMVRAAGDLRGEQAVVQHAGDGQIGAARALEVRAGTTRDVEHHAVRAVAVREPDRAVVHVGLVEADCEALGRLEAEVDAERADVRAAHWKHAALIVAGHTQVIRGAVRAAAAHADRGTLDRAVGQPGPACWAAGIHEPGAC